MSKARRKQPSSRSYASRLKTLIQPHLEYITTPEEREVVETSAKKLLRFIDSRASKYYKMPLERFIHVMSRMSTSRSRSNQEYVEYSGSDNQLLTLVDRVLDNEVNFLTIQAYKYFRKEMDPNMYKSADAKHALRRMASVYPISIEPYNLNHILMAMIYSKGHLNVHAMSDAHLRKRMMVTIAKLNLTGKEHQAEIPIYAG